MRGPMPKRFALEGLKFSLYLVVPFCAVVFFGSSDHSWLEWAVERWRYVEYPVSRESNVTTADITKRVFSRTDTTPEKDS
jgi:hypothetical protein